MTKTDRKRKDEKKLLSLMIGLYCNKNHKTKKGTLCPECSELLAYALKRVDKCPYMEEKTFCSACKTPCYKRDMREKIRLVMKWSGPRMIFFHPIWAIKHLFA